MGDRLSGWAAAAWRPAVIVAITAAAYSNSFGGKFNFDDGHAIRDNPAVREPAARLSALTPRVVAHLSFAANYAVGGLDPWGFHLVNLGVHALAALTLYGLTRRTLLLPSLRERYSPEHAANLALAAALVWAAHPLNTQAVTYVVQRMESMCALFYLFTLYALVRGATAAARPVWAGWYAASVLACGLSMGTKEVGVTIPVVALLFDWCLVGGTLRAVAGRWPVYLALFAVAGGLGAHHAGLLAAGPPSDDPTAGFAMKNLTPWEYARSQPGVILLYLRLAVWPHPLCLDYDWPVADTPAAVVLPGLAIGGLLAASLWAARRRPGLGFLGLTFFVVLAPTSTVLPIRDLAVEHRMYLPLAALVVLGVVAGDAAVRAGWVPACAAAVAVGVLVAVLASATFARNKTYHSAEGMWQDVLAKRPDNARAISLVAIHSRLAGVPPAAALPSFERACRLKPRDTNHLRNLGDCLRDLERDGEAIAVYQDLLARDSRDHWARLGMAACMNQAGRPAEAVSVLEACLRASPGSPVFLAPLGAALRRLGRYDEAVARYRELEAADPANADVRYETGVTLLMGGRPAEAAGAFQEAARLDPDKVKYRHFLAAALDGAGRPADADWEYAAAAAMNPNWPKVVAQAAWTLATDPKEGRRDGPMAVLLARQVNRATGGRDAAVLDVLGTAYAAAGRYAEASATARDAVGRATAAGLPPHAIEALRQRLKLYEQNAPYVRPPVPPG